MLDKIIEAALQKKGFAMVEVIAQCVTYSGRWLGLTSPAEMMKWQRDNSVRVEAAKELTETELAGKIVIGVLTDRERPTYDEEYRRLCAEDTYSTPATPNGRHPLAGTHIFVNKMLVVFHECIS